MSKHSEKVLQQQKAMQSELTKLREENKKLTTWISVEEQLPPNLNDHVVYQVKWSCGGVWVSVFANGSFTDERVCYWREIAD